MLIFHASANTIPGLSIMSSRFINKSDDIVGSKPYGLVRDKESTAQSILFQSVGRDSCLSWTKWMFEADV